LDTADTDGKATRLREALDRASAQSGMYGYTFQKKSTTAIRITCLTCYGTLLRQALTFSIASCPDERDQERVRATLAGGDAIPSGLAIFH
jgi:hypothetical protein